MLLSRVVSRAGNLHLTIIASMNNPPLSGKVSKTGIRKSGVTISVSNTPLLSNMLSGFILRMTSFTNLSQLTRRRLRKSIVAQSSYCASQLLVAVGYLKPFIETLYYCNFIIFILKPKFLYNFLQISMNWDGSLFNKIVQLSATPP